MKLNVKQLKVIALFLVIVLVAIFVIIGGSKNNSSSGGTKKYSNKSIYNNNSHAIRYGDYLYYQNEFTNASGEFKSYLSRVSLVEKNSEPENLINFEKTMITYNNIFLYNNKIYIYNYENTYQYNIETGKVNWFCEGRLHYIDDEKVAFYYNDCIYSADYSIDTNAISNIKKLTKSDITKYAEDNSYIYYVTPGHRNNTLVVGISKKNFDVVTIEDELSIYDEVLQIVSSNDYLFCIVKDIDDDMYVLKINMKNGNKNIIDIPEYEYINAFINDDNKDLFFYANETGETKSLYVVSNDEVKETNKEIKTDLFENYGVEDINGTIYLYNKGMEIGKLENPVLAQNEVILKYAYMIDEYFYYRIDIQNHLNEEEDTEDENYSSDEYIYYPIFIKVSQNDGNIEILSK